jgi:hypothetical protein
VTRSRAGWLLVLGGSVLALALQALTPVGVPLYDGVVVQEPYRFLHPTGDQATSPGSFSETVSVENGGSPVIVAPTTEQPPQAQLIAQRDAFLIPGGVTSIKVSVTPVDPQGTLPAGSTIAGNVYRFAVTDQADRRLAPKPCNGCRSLVLRAPDGTENAAIMRFADGAWQSVQTIHAGTVAMYQANPTVLGDYAVVARAGGVGDATGEDVMLLVLGGGAALLFAAFIGLMFLRARPTPLAPSRPGRGLREGDGDSTDTAVARRSVSDRVPSKRKGSRPPRSGRSGE